MERGWADHIDRSHRTNRKRARGADIAALTQAKLERPETRPPSMVVVRQKRLRRPWDSGKPFSWKFTPALVPVEPSGEVGGDDVREILSLGGRRGFRALRGFILDARTGGDTKRVRSCLRALSIQAPQVDDILLVGALRLTFLFRSELGAAWTDLREATRAKLAREEKDVAKTLVGLL